MCSKEMNGSDSQLRASEFLSNTHGCHALCWMSTNQVWSVHSDIIEAIDFLKSERSVKLRGWHLNYIILKFDAYSCFVAGIYFACLTVVVFYFYLFLFFIYLFLRSHNYKHHYTSLFINKRLYTLVVFDWRILIKLILLQLEQRLNNVEHWKDKHKVVYGEYSIQYSQI